MDSHLLALQVYADFLFFSAKASCSDRISENKQAALFQNTPISVQMEICLVFDCFMFAYTTQ